MAWFFQLFLQDEIFFSCGMDVLQVWRISHFNFYLKLIEAFIISLNFLKCCLFFDPWKKSKLFIHWAHININFPLSFLMPCFRRPMIWIQNNYSSINAFIFQVCVTSTLLFEKLDWICVITGKNLRGNVTVKSYAFSLSAFNRYIKCQWCHLKVYICFLYNICFIWDLILPYLLKLSKNFTNSSIVIVLCILSFFNWIITAFII